MSSVGVIFTIAAPSTVATSLIPIHRHAGDSSWTLLLTALALGHRHTRRGRARDQPLLIVEHVRLAEEQRLAHLDHRPTARRRPSMAGRRKLIFSSIVVFHIPSSWRVASDIP